MFVAQFRSSRKRLFVGGVKRGRDCVSHGSGSQRLFVISCWPTIFFSTEASSFIISNDNSGPENSSLQWNFLVPALRNFPFYHVAIDVSLEHTSLTVSLYCNHEIILLESQCPGYGRSPGDKQTIRSYPDALIAVRPNPALYLSFSFLPAFLSNFIRLSIRFRS